MSSHVFGLFPPVGPEAPLPVLVIHVHFLLASPPPPHGHCLALCPSAMSTELLGHDSLFLGPQSDGP